MHKKTVLIATLIILTPIWGYNIHAASQSKQLDSQDSITPWPK